MTVGARHIVHRSGLISTIPRSGTWHTKYFLRVYNELLRGNPHPDVVALHPRVTDGSDNSYLCDFGLAPLLVDHFVCPGFDELGIPAVAQWHALLESLGGEGFHKKERDMARQFMPQANPDARVCFICRNPFDGEISRANGWHYRVNMTHASRTTLQPPFLEQWPVNVNAYRITRPEDAFEAIIRGFRESRSFEVCLLKLITFVWMKRYFPENVLLLSYDEMQVEPEKSYLALVKHFCLDAPAGEKLDEYVRYALELTSYDRMKEYEKRLGQSLSAKPGAAVDKNHKQYKVATHMPSIKRPPWQELFTKEDFRYAAAKLEEYGLVPEDIGKTFAQQFHPLAA